MKAVNLVWGKTLLAVVCFVFVLALAAGAAQAQNFVVANTTTTLWAGSLDTTQFGFSSFTAPFPGVILSGTAVSTITGKPVRHLWYSDPLNGFCRIDPEVDAVVPPVNGIGGHNVNIATCLASISTPSPVPSQIAFDASTNTLYTADISRTSAGIMRMHYLPGGDSGQGAIDIIHVDNLLGTQTGRNAFGGCPAVKDPKTGALVPSVPNSAALGPDGNLYTGSIRDGAIIRIMSPATFNTATDCPNNGNGNQVPQPTDKIQIPILSTDETTTTGHTFGLGFVGSSLFGADNVAPWMMTNAAQCFTQINGNKICGSPALGGNAAPMPTEFLGTQVGAPQAGLVSDAVYPASPGAVAYAATFSSVARLSNIVSPTSMTVNLNYGGRFSFITGMVTDPQDPNNGTVYVGADPTQGGINGSGQIWQVSGAFVCPPSAPIPPTITSAVAGLSQATVSWAPIPNGCPISSYIVRTLLAGGTASGLADVTVLAPTTTATVLGLTNGSSYQFEVEACNLTGCSPFSALSNVVSLTPPAALTGVTATVLSATSAGVSWKPSGDGSITSYTVSAFDSASPSVVAATVTILPVQLSCARLNCGFPITVSGLLSGHTYTFTVHATNLFGNSAESAPSLPITLPVTADVAITMTSPVGSTVASYTMTITNNGPGAAAQVNLADTLPAPLASFTTTQGVCTGPVGALSLSCNLGPLAAGASATVTVTASVPACGGTFTNVATVNALDSSGANMDPNLANNTAAATVAITVLNPACVATTTDIQVTGAAQNGNPVHGTPDVFTWQIKNNLGTVSANGVTFTATTTAPTGAVLAVNATNPAGTATPGCTFTATTVSCSLGTIAGGQTAIVTVTATPSSAAPANSYSMTGNAQLGIGSTDTNPANNSFTVKIGAQ